MQTGYADNYGFHGDLRTPVDDADVESVIPDSPRQAQVDEIAVSGANANTTYEIEIDGHTISHETGSGPGIDDLVNGLTEAINDKAEVSGTVLAEADTTNDKVTVTERVVDGDGFTMTEVTDSPGHLSISTTTSPKDAEDIPFGRAVRRDGQIRGTLKGKLPDAGDSDVTARELVLTLDGSADGDYRVRVEVNGETVEAEYTAATDGADTILSNLSSALSHNLISTSVDTGANPSELIINPETAGFADFQVLEASGASQINTITRTEGTDVPAELIGATFRSDTMERSGGNDAKYPGQFPMNVLADRGSIVLDVENSPSAGDPVYVRLKANGTLDKIGHFRTDWNSGCVPVPRWYVDKTLPDGKAVVEITR
ncbi:MAG: hypothetical protein ABEN55_12210 [Bradymonadaceae bacterium]